MSKPKKKRAKVPVATCKKPDPEFPALVCGYPLPCPKHAIRVAVVVEPRAGSETIKKVARGDYD